MAEEYPTEEESAESVSPVHTLSAVALASVVSGRRLLQQLRENIL